MSVLWPIVRQLMAHPSRLFITDDQRTWKGAELLVGALHLASEIERRSNAPHIGIMLPTGGLFPIAAMAGWMLGRTIVPLNYLLRGEELQYVCDHSGIDTIITVQPMLDFLKPPPRVANMIRFEDINFRSMPELRWPKRAADDDLAALLYTSGTSGRPKGVMLTHGNLKANIRQCLEWAGFGRHDKILGVLPQFHIFGLTVLTLLPLTAGLPVVFTARFVPRKIVKLMRQHRPTVLLAIASMYNAFLTVKDSTADDWKSLRFVVSGGEPLPDAVSQAFIDRFDVQLNEGYGLTETSAVTHWCRPHECRPHTVGKAMPRIDVRIVDEDGNDCGANKDGEIRMAGANIMHGYYRNLEETARAFDARGYFRTGDIGRVDEEGFLYITGRLKEMMIIGGENVFPREIEEVINKHPSVVASGVIGIKDPSRGEVPVAFVELDEGAVLNETELRAHCREYLAQYKVPREIHHLEALPKNPTGKIMRRELKVPEASSAQ